MRLREAEASVRAARPRWARYACLAGEAVVLALVTVQLWRHGQQVVEHVGLDFQVEYEEGNTLNALVRIAHGLTPYPDPGGIPSVFNIYGPLGYYVLAVPVKLFGVSFLWPRLAVIACVVGICCLIGRLVARSTGSSLHGLVFGALYAALPVVEAWSVVLRVDFLAVLLTTAGLWVFGRGAAGEAEADAPRAPGAERRARGPGAAGERHVWAAALLFAGALLVKQTFLAAPGACALYLVRQRDWKGAGRLIGLVGAGVAAGLVPAAALTRLAILTHMFDSHADPLSLGRYALFLGGMVATHHVLVFLAAVGIVAPLVRGTPSVAGLWLVLSSLSAVTASKLGSNLNHFLEWSAALCLCAALGWATLCRLRPAALAAASLLAVTAGLGAFLSRAPSSPFHEEGILAECGLAYAFVRQHPGDRILSENVGALVLGRKPVWISNPFVYSQRVMRGGRPDAGLERMLRAREFDLIVTSRDYARMPAAPERGAERFTPGAVRAIVEHYQPVARFRCRDAVVMWERRPSPG
jgi:hypothetical protein